MFVLDTNTLIYFFKGEGRVAEHLWSTPPHEIAVPAVVLYELHVGIAKSTHPQKRLMQLRQFLGCTRVLPFGQGEAECAARVRADLELRGEGIGPMDTLITLLDYGCGSGILGIAALKLGAADVLGVDIDASALTAAAEIGRAHV